MELGDSCAITNGISGFKDGRPITVESASLNYNLHSYIENHTYALIITRRNVYSEKHDDEAVAIFIFIDKLTKARLLLRSAG